MRGLLAAAAAAAALIVLAAPAARAGGPSMMVGAAEDDVKATTLAEAKAKLDLLKLAGLDAVRVTSIWDPLNPDPPPDEITSSATWLTEAAKLDGMRGLRLGLQLRQQDDAAQRRRPGELRRARRRPRPRTCPTCQNFIIGNEPNLNRFWLPQFNAGRRRTPPRPRTSSLLAEDVRRR